MHTYIFQVYIDHIRTEVEIKAYCLEDAKKMLQARYPASLIQIQAYTQH